MRKLGAQSSTYLLMSLRILHWLQKMNEMTHGGVGEGG